MKNTNWIVITGAPCSGKTKVLERLSFLGYKVYPEISRILIDNLASNNVNIEDYIANKVNLENDILSLKLQLEKRTNEKEIYFFDRGMIDSYAFMKYYNVNMSNFETFLSHRYKHIFFLESVPYEIDKYRFEKKEQIEQISSEIRQAYKKYNYPIIDIPLLPIDKRVELIINKIYKYAYQY